MPLRKELGVIKKVHEKEFIMRKLTLNVYMYITSTPSEQKMTFLIDASSMSKRLWKLFCESNFMLKIFKY